MPLALKRAFAASRRACIPRRAVALGALVPCSLLGLIRPSSVPARCCASHSLAHARLAVRPWGSLGPARHWAGTLGWQQRRGKALRAYDEEQLRLLDSDECILVDEHDEVLGHGSKKFCHLMDNIDRHKALHRAFSIFLFDENGRMLLQKRSDDKILFPARWTNTCCSHPLFNPRELDDPPSPTADGVRRAAVRKLGHELGISAETVGEDDLIYMTRILYKAAVEEDSVWGEHEVDYIFLAQARDIKYSLNPNEVSEVAFVQRGELQQWLDAEAAGRIALSPWFRAVAGQLLPRWWDAMLEALAAISGPGRFLSRTCRYWHSFSGAMDKIMPALAGVAGLYVASKAIPVMYRWELIPGVGSPEYQAKAKTIRYDHYTEGIIYSPYDTGDPIREMPAASAGKMYLKQKGGGWKFASEM